MANHIVIQPKIKLMSVPIPVSTKSNPPIKSGYYCEYSQGYPCYYYNHNTDSWSQDGKPVYPKYWIKHCDISNYLNQG